jgi:N-acetylneuraminic acid mutarotase
MPRRPFLHTVSCTLLVLVLNISLAEQGGADPMQEEMLPGLPQPVSNNAVALLADKNGYQLYSMLGLHAGKSWRDTSSEVMQFSSATGSWRRLDPVPGEAGRLAASAVVAGGEIYLFGGYTVSEDGSEQSTTAVYRLQRESGRWQLFSDMPVAVEDSVLLVYQDRYIYLVSGWHDLGNVNLVQMLDTETGRWQQATPYPGRPVFGHSGDIFGNRFVICDGVALEYAADASPRKFTPTSACWLGRISSADFRRIDWRPIKSHPGPPRYRMAAGEDGAGRIVFAGGSVNPYNFNGIGYDGEPSQPGSAVFSYNFTETSWECHGDLSVSTMDHRGLPMHEGWLYIIGGMRKNQQVSTDVRRFKPGSGRPCSE